jgi:hypothetical protein
MMEMEIIGADEVVKQLAKLADKDATKALKRAIAKAATKAKKAVASSAPKGSRHRSSVRGRATRPLARSIRKRA